MDLTINAYRPVQRQTYKPMQRPAYKPVFKGGVHQSTIELLSKAGRFRGAELQSVIDECLALRGDLTEFMKKYPDKVELRIYDLRANIGASFRFEHPDIKNSIAGIDAGYFYYGDNSANIFEAIKICSTKLKENEALLPENVNPQILDNIMKVDPKLETDIVVRDRVANEFAESANLLERYKANKEQMFARYKELNDRLDVLRHSTPSIDRLVRINKALGLPATSGLPYNTLT